MHDFLIKCLSIVNFIAIDIKFSTNIYVNSIYLFHKGNSVTLQKSLFISLTALNVYLKPKV